MMETDILSHLVDLLQERDWKVRRYSVKTITALAEFGRLTYFGVYKGLIVQQRISTPRWRKLMSLVVLLTP